MTSEVSGSRWQKECLSVPNWIFSNSKTSWTTYHMSWKLHKRALRIIVSPTMILYYNILDTLLYMFPGFMQLTINKQTTNKQNPTFRHDLFVAKESHSSMRNGSQIIQPKVRTKKYGLNYFRCQWSKRWNSLPPDMKLAASQSWLTNLLLK